MDNLSPTAKVLALASESRDVAMRLAYEAEGTDREAGLDEMYRAADEAYLAACVAHRAARDAWENPDR